MFLAVDKAFCGSIKYPLHRLKHESVFKNPRQLDQRNVERLTKIYELEGCLRFDKRNHVPALISKEPLVTLLDSVIGGEIRLRSLDEEPLLVDTPSQLLYLHGRHRLEAAKCTLPAGEKWWVVDLYAEEQLSEEAVQSLRDEHLNARNWFDGDVFRQIRHAHLTANEDGKKKWLCRLSEAKRRDVEILEKRKDNESKSFAESFDNLIPFTGLWPALQIGTFHRLLSLRCPEEMTRYLHYVWRVWNQLAQGQSSHIDAITVEILQGRCPRSLEDRRHLENYRSSICSSMIDPQARQELWERIVSIDYIIPSLHTFLEDTKYLEPCAKIMKRLLPVKCKGTVHQAFERLHNGQTSLRVQLTDESSAMHDQSSAALTHWKAYRQLWLFAMRHFPEMMGHAPRKDGPREYPVPCSELIWWFRVAELAIECGYEGVKQPFSRMIDADVKMTEEFLRRVRPPSSGLSGVDFNHKVNSLIKIIQDIEPPQDVEQPMSTKDACLGDLAHRCGVPFEQSYHSDKRYLFLDAIYGPSQSEETLTSFDVKRCMFHNFFGDLDPEVTTIQARSRMPVPTTEYSISEYSQPSGSMTPRPMTPKDFELNYRPESQLRSSFSLVSTPQSLRPVEPSSPESTKGRLQISPSSARGEQLQTISNQLVPQFEAKRIFWLFQSTPDREKIVILKQESAGMFRISVFARNDQRSITNTLIKSNAYVSDCTATKRLRLTNLFDIRKRREPCVLLCQSQYAEQVRIDFEQE